MLTFLFKNSKKVLEPQRFFGSTWCSVRQKLKTGWLEVGHKVWKTRFLRILSFQGAVGSGNPI